MAPALLAIPGCGALTAAKIVGETAGVARLRSKRAYVRWNVVALLEAHGDWIPPLAAGALAPTR